MAATQVSDVREPKTAPSDEIKAPSSRNAAGEVIPSTQEEQAQQTQEPTPLPSEGTRDNREVLVYEGQLIGWDRRLWAQRYGVLTNTDDDAPNSDLKTCGQQGTFKNPLFWSFTNIFRPNENKDLGFGDNRCEICPHKASTDHHSYIKDITRRIEPMVASLVNLEHQVAHLVHRLGMKENARVDRDPANGTQVKDKVPQEIGG